jgi:hypothetical protein
LLEDLILLSLVFGFCVVAIILYARRLMKRPYMQPATQPIHIRIDEFPRPLDTANSVKALKILGQVEEEEKEISRLLKEIEGFDRGREG